MNSVVVAVAGGLGTHEADQRDLLTCTDAESSSGLGQKNVQGEELVACTAILDSMAATEAAAVHRRADDGRRDDQSKPDNQRATIAGHAELISLLRSSPFPASPPWIALQPHFPWKTHMTLFDPRPEARTTKRRPFRAQKWERDRRPTTLW